MKKLLLSLGGGLAVFAFALAMPAFAAAPNWDVSGTWVFDYNDGTTNLHDMTLVQDGVGNLTGSGGAFSGSLPYTYPWTIDSGSVDGNAIVFTAHYTATVVCSFTATGTIASAGTMSGTWTDDCVPGGRTGTWETTSGTAKMFVITKPATSVLSTSATLNGTNGPVNADGKSFWMGPALPAVPFYPADTPTTVSQLQNWYSVSGDYNPLAADADFSSTQTGLIPGTTYYFVAWSFVGGTWYPGEILSFTTEPNLVGPPTNKDECKKDGWKTFNNPTFKNQGACVSYLQSNENAGKRN